MSEKKKVILIYSITILLYTFGLVFTICVNEPKISAVLGWIAAIALGFQTMAMHCRIIHKQDEDKDEDK